ncbi:hypothetical protein ME9_01022 [Bartonella taylorii 8TBB]|uniref:Uncharacterized protein n=1 Tax=Bartonella taylorii 8TBB TaxID=1094560 RepID=A0A9P2RZ61_BARTA|nr:hypothetical protein ME9_01022 [Bartonella taylorii 8TBB]
MPCTKLNGLIYFLVAYLRHSHKSCRNIVFDLF